jgi:hypothetical protein
MAANPKPLKPTILNSKKVRVGENPSVKGFIPPPQGGGEKSFAPANQQNPAL